VLREGLNIETDADTGSGLVWDGSYFWIVNWIWGTLHPTNTDILYKVDTNGVTIDSWLHPAQSNINMAMGLAWDGAHLWNVGVQYHDKSLMYELTPAGVEVQHWKICDYNGSQSAWGVAWDGTTLWVSLVDPARLVQFDTAGNELAYFDIAEPKADLTWYDGYLWAVEIAPVPSLVKYDTSTGTEIARWAKPATIGTAGGICHNGEYFWLVEWDIGRLNQLLWTGGIATSAHFSGSILVVDSSLTASSNMGQHKIQRGTWSERFPVPDSADTIWANPFTTVSRTELIEGKGNIQTRFANSLDGDWQAAQELESDYSCPYGIEALGMLYISAYKDGKQYLLRRQRHGEHTAMEAPLEIADSDEVAASLAFFPLQWSLACAVQHNNDTKLYLSHDHGQSWSLKHTIADLLYPSLFCDEKLLWLVGYVDGAYEGASGRVSVAAYRVSSLALPESQALTTIGPADAGRPAIIREKNTWLVRALAPRITDWGDGEAAPSIVEYVSNDVGQTWSQAGVHAV